MNYKGYSATVEFDEDSGVLFGRVIGLRDVITFQGTSVAEVTQAFQDSVDDYLEFCAERSESPEKPYSGHFVVRIAPELHRAIANLAEAQGVSLNHVVQTALGQLFPDIPGKGTTGDVAGRAIVSARGSKKSKKPVGEVQVKKLKPLKKPRKP